MSSSDRKRARNERERESARWWSASETTIPPAGSGRGQARPGLAEGPPIRMFRDRREAGRLLASRLLRSYAGRPDLVVLGLPRGGVPVAFEVAQALKAPLDVFVVRKLGVPGEEEFAMGAIASGGVCVLNDEAVDALQIAPEMIERAVERERDELERRERLYRGDQAPLDVAGRTVLVVDDGLATGSTMRAAVAALRRREPARIVVAVPTAAPSTCAEFRGLADDCVSVIRPDPFRAVGCWYFDFSQTTDEEVCDLLHQAWERADGPRTIPPTLEPHGESQP